MSQPNVTRRGQHVVELLIDSQEIDVKRVGSKVAIMMSTRKAQQIYDGLRGLVPTLEPFEEFDKKQGAEAP